VRKPRSKRIQKKREPKLTDDDIALMNMVLGEFINECYSDEKTKKSLRKISYKLYAIVRARMRSRGEI
jgi:hypothetical protein